MVQKIHPRGVIWVHISRLMWADQLKKLTAVPSIYQEVHDLGKEMKQLRKELRDREKRAMKETLIRWLHCNHRHSGVF